MATNTWTETDPTGSSLRSLGDDAIRQFKLDIRERLAAEHVSGDGTAIEAADFTEARHKLSSIGLLGLLKGLRIEQRSYATSGNITVSGKLQIEINGDMCYLNSDTNLAFSGLSASTSYYIYVASPGHETELGAGNLSYSTTAPTYSTSKKGWYNGTSRAIGFFRTDTGSKIVSFIQTRYIYSFHNLNPSWQLNSGQATTLTEVTNISLVTPVFVGSEVKLRFNVVVSATNSGYFFYLSTDGTNNIRLQRFDAVGLTAINNADGEITCPLSSSRTLYYKVSNVSHYLYLLVIGFDLDGSL